MGREGGLLTTMCLHFSAHRRGRWPDPGIYRLREGGGGDGERESSKFGRFHVKIIVVVKVQNG